MGAKINRFEIIVQEYKIRHMYADKLENMFALS